MKRKGAARLYMCVNARLRASPWQQGRGRACGQSMQLPDISGIPVGNLMAIAAHACICETDVCPVCYALQTKFTGKGPMEI